MLTKDQRELLAPHAKHFQAMAEHVYNLGDAELAELLRACNAASDTNCGWGIYLAAQRLKYEAETEIGCRARRAEEAARPTPAADGG